MKIGSMKIENIKIGNIKIGTRLGLAFGIIMVFMGIFSMVAIDKMKELSGLTLKLYRHPFTVSTAAIRIDGNIVKMHRSMKDIALAKNETDIDVMSNLVSEYEKLVYDDFEIIRKRFLGDKTDVEAAVKMFADWKPIRDEVINLMRSGERQKAADITMTISANYVKNLDQTMRVFIDFARNKADNFVENAGTARDNALNMMYALIAVTLIASIILAIMITRSIKIPILKTVEMAKNLSKGDFTRTLKINQTDEIGQMAEDLNGAMGNLRNIIKEVAKTSNNMSGSSEELSAISSQMAASAEEMNSQANMVAASSEQVSSSVSTVAAAAEQASSSVSNIATMTEEISSTFTNVSESASKTSENVKGIAESGAEMSDQINTVASAIEEMTSSLNEVAQNTAKGSLISQNAGKRTELINARMDALASASNKIGKVVSMIKNIADQTNMLALNATIEAAGAGEAGKGFAVVAGEVKELAKQSADATNEISDQIEEIQSTTDAAVKVIDEISKVISEIVGINTMIASSVEEQNATASEISRSVARTASNVNSVAERSSQSALLVTEIAKATDETAQSASEIARNVEEFRNGIREVAQSSNEAARGVSEISKNIQAIGTAARQTSTGAAQTSDSSKKLAQMAVALTDIVNQFKV